MTFNSYLGTITPGFKTTSSYFYNRSGVVDNLHFRVNVARGKPDNLNISLSDLNGNVDIDLWRDLDRDGRINPTKDIRLHSRVLAGNLDEVLNVQLGYSGNYIAQIRALDGDRGSYKFRMTNTGQSPSDLLQGEKSLGQLGYDPAVLKLESLHSGDTANVYQFSMATAGNFNAGLTGLRAGTNVDMRLVQDRNNNGFIDAGEVIAESDRSNNADEFLNIKSLAAGNYFLQTNFRGDANAQYTLKLSDTGEAPNNLLPVRLDFGNLGRPVSTSTHVLRPNRSSQVMAFDLAQGSNFNGFLYRNGDSTIRLVHDGNSNGIVDDGEVVFSSRKGTGSEIVNIYSLKGGAYYLQADLGTGDYADYEALVSNSGSNPSNLLYGKADAGQLSKAPVAYRDSLGQMDAVDTYQFELQSTGNMNAALTHIGANADIGMRVVHDSNNNHRVDDGDTVYAEFGSGQSDRAINQRLQAGSYFLQAFTKNGVASDYKLKLSTTGAGPSNLLPTETAVGPIDGPKQFYGVVEGANTTDTYRFSLGYQRTVTFNLGDLNGNADLRLIHDANHNGIVDPGEEFKRAASLGNSPETITKTLEAGDYFAQVYAPTLEATSYTLNMA